MAPHPTKVLSRRSIGILGTRESLLKKESDANLIVRTPDYTANSPRAAIGSQPEGESFRQLLGRVNCNASAGVRNVGDAACARFTDARVNSCSVMKSPSRLLPEFAAVPMRFYWCHGGSGLAKPRRNKLVKVANADLLPRTRLLATECKCLSRSLKYGSDWPVSGESFFDLGLQRLRTKRLDQVAVSA